MNEKQPSNTIKVEPAKISFATERCVRNNRKFSQCRSCADVCPEGALTIRENAVSFDEEQCTACGLCTAACVEESFRSDIRIQVSELKGVKFVYFACTRSSWSSNESLHCVAALSLSQISHLYLQGVRTYFILSGDCGSCSYSANLDIFKRFTQLNLYLSSLSLPTIDYSLLNSKAFLALKKRVHKAQTKAKTNRRGFFRQAMRQVATTSERVLGDIQEPPQLHHNLHKLAELNPSRHLALFSVTVDFAACTVCSDCTKVCPHDALTFGHDANELYFSIDPYFCTACRACEDICQEGAISVDENLPGKKARLELHRVCCASCGVTFYDRKASSEIQKHCTICRSRKVSQDQSLFQVY